MELKKISFDLKTSYENFVNEWKENNEEITPYSARLLDRNFEEFVKDSEEFETKAPENFVTATTFYLVEDEEILGAINIRHKLNDGLINSGGHIGYGVTPSKRGKGYAKLMLDMILPFLKEKNLDRVLLTCDSDNIASAKTITKFGGVLENQIENNENKITNRYWATVK